MDAAKYYEEAHIEETEKDFIVPRRSLTRKLLLEFFPPQVEYRRSKWRQLDKTTGKMVEGSDRRVSWRSDKTLLNPGKPQLEIGTFKREGYIAEGLNKRTYRETEKEVRAVLEDMPISVDRDDLPWGSDVAFAEKTARKTR